MNLENTLAYISNAGILAVFAGLVLLFMGYTDTGITFTATGIILAGTVYLYRRLVNK